MNNSIKNMYRIVTFICFMQLISCEVPLDDSKIKKTDKLVINALVNDQEPIAVYVSNTIAVNDTNIPAALSDANVELTDNLGNSFTLFYNNFDRVYRSTHIPKSGRIYTITANHSKYGTATGKFTIPAKGSYLKATWKDSFTIDNAGFPLGIIRSKINDNGSEENYYRVTLKRWDPSLAVFVITEPQFIDAEIQKDAVSVKDGGFVISDKNYQGKTIPLEFLSETGIGSQSIKYLLRIENLSKDYYQFFTSSSNPTRDLGIFSEPRQVFTNIDNGLGITAGSSLYRDTVR